MAYFHHFIPNNPIRPAKATKRGRVLQSTQVKLLQGGRNKSTHLTPASLIAITPGDFTDKSLIDFSCSKAGLSAQQLLTLPGPANNDNSHGKPPQTSRNPWNLPGYCIEVVFYLSCLPNEFFY